MLAGTHSGCGKTTVSLALMAACARRGMQVQPFKVGPDFIDPGLHAAASGRTSHNLDGWMLGRDCNRTLFQRHAHGCDIAIVEGVMGLFDGASGVDETGSSAEMAKWLGLPVLLVVDARSMARSAAALVHGFATFDPALHLAGVIFNRVGSPRHRELLEEAMHATGVPIAGFLEREPDVELPSRHLGLHTAADGVLHTQRVNALADWVEKGVPLPDMVESLPQITTTAFSAQSHQEAPPYTIRLGVAKDRAFCFYYPENFRLLQELGAELVFFSPLEDSTLPQHLDGLYFGGGYPELYARELSQNTSMRQAVQAFGFAGKPVYGECGGFMYLMAKLEAKDAPPPWPMVGLFDMDCRMEPRLRSLGYREVEISAPTLFGPPLTTIKGHEFHYSFISRPDATATKVYTVLDRRGRPAEAGGYMKGNVLGSYVHMHFGSNPKAAAAFLAACADSKTP